MKRDRDEVDELTGQRWVPVLVHPTYGPVVYPFVASASFGPVLRRKQPA